jgi:hypothetical protein
MWYRGAVQSVNCGVSRAAIAASHCYIELAMDFVLFDLCRRLSSGFQLQSDVIE